MSKDKLILSYFGTLGLSQNIPQTFEYADVISKRVENFHYLVIGDGAEKKIVTDTAAKYAFAEIRPLLPPEELEQYYNETLLSIISLKKSDNFQYTIPSKLFQIMGRGVAVLFIGPDGETADIVRKYHTGIVLDGSNEQDYQQLSDFFSKPDWYEQLKMMGKNGARTVKEKYSRKYLAQKYLEILESVR